MIGEIDKWEADRPDSHANKKVYFDTHAHERMQHLVCKLSKQIFYILLNKIPLLRNSQKHLNSPRKINHNLYRIWLFTLSLATDLMCR